MSPPSSSHSSASVVAHATALALDGSPDRAVGVLRAHLAAAPGDARAQLALGMVLSSESRWEEAADALGRAVALDGQTGAGRVALARALEELGRLADAATELREAARVAATDARPWKELGAVLYRMGLHDDAVVALGRARELAPSDARVLYSIGLVEESRRDPGAAIVAYREAVRLDPQLGDAYKTLADVLAQMGEHEQAIAVLDGLLRVERTNEQAAHNRDVLCRALAEMKKRRLLGKTAREVEGSALVTEGQLQHKGRIDRPAELPDAAEVVRWRASLIELEVGFSAFGAALWLFFVLVDPERARDKPGDAFRVTVVSAAGAREPADYATAASLTFLREGLGAPMTQASQIYARLLAQGAPWEAGGVRVRFVSASRPGRPGESLHGLLIERG